MILLANPAPRREVSTGRHVHARWATCDLRLEIRTYTYIQKKLSLPDTLR